MLQWWSLEVPGHSLVAVLGKGCGRGRGRLVEGEAAVAVNDGGDVEKLPVLGRTGLHVKFLKVKLKDF